MDSIDQINQLVQQQRDNNFSRSQQLSLGQLIEEIEKCGLKREYNGEDKVVHYDFGTAIPTVVDSWRGSYAELALGYCLTGYDNDREHLKEISAKDLLQNLKDAVGKTFTGWKGGDFRMSKETPVWVANPGNGGDTAIVGVLDNGWRLILITAYCEF
jgi:hypothetical protein